MTTNGVTFLLDVLGIIGLISGGLIVLFSRVSKERSNASIELIANLQTLRETDKEAFEKRLSILEAGRKKDGEAIANLQGQLDTYKNLPLREWAETMKDLAATNKKTEHQLDVIASSNEEMLKTLKSSAMIAATDRDVLLTPASQTIKEQRVEHQVIQSEA